MKGFNDPATPDELDRVGVLKIGPERARNVLVLNPGTSGGATYFKPLAQRIVRETKRRWQVWAVERRENQLEDHSVLNRGKRDKVTSQRVFDYYLGWLADSNIEDHFELIPDAEVEFARGWGLNVEIKDLRRVVNAAAKQGRRVVMGGHSLGGSITTAYATWDFNGEAGCRGPLGPRLHRRRQQPDADHARAGDRVARGAARPGRRGSPSAGSARRSSGSSRRRGRPGRVVESRRGLAWLELSVPAGEPEASRRAHERGTVRLRGRRGHLAADTRRRAGERRAARRRAANRAGGCGPARSRRCGATRRCSRGRG